MITAKQVIDGLLEAGLCTEGSVKRKRRGDYPAYTNVTGSGRVNVSEETYGKQSEMYFRCEDEATAKETHALLKKLGGKPSFKWCTDDPTSLSCDIYPIKGYHWWE